MVPTIEDQIFEYQSRDPIVIYFNSDQGACSYRETFEATLVDTESDGQLPSFIELSTKDQSITISKPGSFATLGNYTIELRGTLENTIKTSNSTQFTVQVVNSALNAAGGGAGKADSFTLSQSSGQFQLSLSDQFVVVGQSLTLPIEYFKIKDSIEDLLKSDDALPLLMQATVGMQQIKSFATFDTATNELLIDGERLSEANVGFYTIKVSAKFTNGTHSEFIQDKFRLEVRSARPAIEPITDDGSDKSIRVAAENLIVLDEWDGLIEQAESAE